MKSLPHWTIYLVAAVVVGLRLAALVPLSGNPLILNPVLEDANYQARALEIRGGSLLDSKLPRGSVLYPYLAAATPEAKGSSTRPLSVLQGFLEGGTALLLMLWIRRRAGMAAALIAGVLYGLDPTGAFFAARFSPVVPGTFLFVLALWLFDKEADRTNFTFLPAVLVGVVAAIGFFLMPLPFLFLLLLRALALLRETREKGAPRPWAAALVPLGPLVLLAGLVMVQHASIPDGAPLLGWGGGPALYDAVNPSTGGTPRGLKPPSWDNDWAWMTQAWETLQGEGTLRDVYRFYTVQALQRAIESPLATIGVLLTKAAGSIGAFPIPDSLSPVFLYRRSAPLFTYGASSFALLFGLGIAGLWLLRGDPRGHPYRLGLAAVGLSALLGLASAASRQPGLPLLAGLGGIAIARFLRLRDDLPEEKREEKRKGPARPAKKARPAPEAASVPAAAPVAAPAGAPAAAPVTALAVAAGALALSLAAGYISPTSALRNPSEDLRLLATVLSGTRSLDQAIPILEESVRRNAKNIESRVMLSQAYEADALTEPAMEQLEAAYQADSTHAGTLYYLAQAYQKREEPERALATMVRLVNLHPNNPLYLNELGNLFLMRGNYPQATQLFSRALQLKPDYEVARQNLVTTETYRQRMEDSLFPRSMALGPEDPFSLAIPRLMQSMDGSDWTKADSILTWGESLHPNAIEPPWFRAAYWARRGDAAQAKISLERCNTLAPGRPAIVQQLADTYLQTGDEGKLPGLFDRSLAAAGADSTRARMLAALRKQALGGAR